MCVKFYFPCLGTHRCIVLDALDVSIKGTAADSPERKLAEQMLAAVQGANNVPWNGAIGVAQLAWFDAQLREAHAAGQRAIVFCHIPFAPDATSTRHLLWNWSEALAVLDRHSNVQACFYGHYHKGGYCLVRLCVNQRQNKKTHTLFGI